MKKYPERARERMLSPEELGQLGEALNRHDCSPYVVAAIKLLMLTGARLSEVLSMRWDQVDLERGEARLAVHKTARQTGSKTIHLPPPALKVLEDLAMVDVNPHVIVGHVKGARLVNLQKPWRGIRADAALDEVRIHDLRQCFASIAASSGMVLHIIGKMLGHSQPQTTHRYAHLAV